MNSTRIVILALTTLLLPGWENPPDSMTRYAGRLTVHRVPFNDILKHCPKTGRAWACSYRSRGSCRIYIPSDLQQSVTESLYRHEVAHCSGWNH